MLEKVAIAGLGFTEFNSVSPGSSYRELTYEAAVKAYEEVGIEPKDVDSFVCTSEDFLEGYSISDEYCNDQLGAVLKSGQTIPGDFIHSLSVGVMHILTGLFDIVVVQALSKASNMKTIPEMVNFAFDPVLTRPLDITSYFTAGLEMNRYLAEERATREQCAAVVVKNKANALINPVAAYGADVTIEQVVDSEPIAEPVRLLDIAPYADGAVVLVLCSEKTAGSLTEKPVWIKGVGWSTDAPSLESRDWTEGIATRLAGDMAYKMAGIRNPVKEIQVIELHDAFIKQLQITMAEMGFTELGRSDDLINEGLMTPGGPLLVNPSGGLTYGGHFVGGSNMFSCWSARRELIQRELQRGLVHGTGSTIAQFGCVMIMERRS